MDFDTGPGVANLIEECGGNAFFQKLDENEKGTINATKGLIEYRNGNYVQGRLLYNEAIKTFKKN